MTQIYFIDQVGASRKTVEECRGGVEHIMVGDKVYWPLTAEGTKRLIRAGCGDGEFTEPAPDEFAPRTPVPTMTHRPNQPPPPPQPIDVAEAEDAPLYIEWADWAIILTVAGVLLAVGFVIGRLTA